MRIGHRHCASACGPYARGPLRTFPQLRTVQADHDTEGINHLADLPAWDDLQWTTVMSTAGIEEALPYGIHVVHGPVRNCAATMRVSFLVSHVEAELNAIDVEPRVDRFSRFLTVQLGPERIRPPSADLVR